MWNFLKKKEQQTDGRRRREENRGVQSPAVRSTQKNQREIRKQQRKLKREKQRAEKRENRKVQRDLKREIRKLEREERKIEKEMRRSDRRNYTKTSATLQQHLVNLLKVKSICNAVRAQAKENEKRRATRRGDRPPTQPTESLVTLLRNASEVMGAMHKKMPPEQLANIIQEFQTEFERITEAQQLVMVHS
ncbi:uncharacterized protein [Antedon mediterranea]|uniref:uncharacterized protein n=1 Tax=Antedon mediterranea TaxID=105859 RepID=UPI003AF7946C